MADLPPSSRSRPQPGQVTSPQDAAGSSVSDCSGKRCPWEEPTASTRARNNYTRSAAEGRAQPHGLLPAAQRLEDALDALGGPRADGARRWHRLLSGPRGTAARRRRARHHAVADLRDVRMRVTAGRSGPGHLDRPAACRSPRVLRWPQRGSARGRRGAGAKCRHHRRQRVQRFAGSRWRAGAPGLDAAVELASAAGRRSLPIQEFIVGNRTTLRRRRARDRHLHPQARAVAASTFVKLGARRYLVISIVRSRRS